MREGCVGVRDGWVCVRGGRVYYEDTRREGVLALGTGEFALEEGVCVTKIIQGRVRLR